MHHRDNSLYDFVTVIIISLLYFLMFQSNSEKHQQEIDTYWNYRLFYDIYNENKNLSGNIKYNVPVPKLFFGIMTMDNAEFKQKHSYDVWVKNILDLGHDYVFLTDNRTDGPYKYFKIHESIMKMTTKRNPNTNREMKRLAIAKYFIENTSADFLFNTCDDVLVDYNRINRLGKILASRYDTYNNIAYLGNCFCAPKKNIYIQGGSGFIMTRAGAVEFLKYSERWLRESRREDDVELNRMFKYMNMTSANATSPYFSGHVPEPMQKMILNLSTLPVCPNHWESNCEQGVHRMKDLYLIHNSNISQHDTIWTNFQNILHDKTRQYGWYGIWPFGHLCIMSDMVQYKTRDQNDDLVFSEGNG